jgi:hypothetical protein
MKSVAIIYDVVTLVVPDESHPWILEKYRSVAIEDFTSRNRTTYI